MTRARRPSRVARHARRRPGRSHHPAAPAEIATLVGLRLLWPLLTTALIAVVFAAGHH